MSVRVKICGVTRVEDAEAAIAAGADVIGFNFYPPSPRNLPLERALAVRKSIGASALVAGVFVNAAREHIDDRRRSLALDLLQFHGDEDEAALRGWPVPVIRALRLPADSTTDVVRDAIARSRADFILLDTYDAKLYGGTGRARRFEQLAGLDLSRVFLSGGLNCHNVAEAAALQPYAVDVAGGVESAPGIKDHANLRSFIANAKSAR